jgi:hypothetical protein
MSQKRRRRSTGPHRKARSERRAREVTVRIPLWPVAVHWYLEQERLALYSGVRVRQEPDGPAFVSLPGVGEVRLEARQLPSALTTPDGECAAAVLCDDGAFEALIGIGQTADEAIDEVLGAVEEAFVDEVGTRRAAALSASVLGQHPELADERSVRSALAWLVIGAPSL